MPCPYFEPQRIAADPRDPTTRLPLLDEYDGVCHAQAVPVQAPAPLRFRCCNHGYSHGICEHLPPGGAISCTRYHVVRRTDDTLDILCIEEHGYAPVHWHSFHYCVQTGCVEPELIDLCRRTQLLAFCRSYLQRFSE